MARWFLWLGCGLVGVVVLLGVAQVIAAEGIEVVTVRAPDAEGETRETRVWILDDAGRVYVRGGAGGWTSRVLESGTFELERAGTRRTVTGELETDDAERLRVNRLFREKYGWRDTFISYLIGDADRSGAVVIRVRDGGA